MSQSSIELMQDTMNRNLTGTHHQQRMALASISSRSATANVGALEFLRNYFYATFQAEAATAIPATAAPIAADLAPAVVAATAIQCRNCGRAFKSQTALNGHGEARCQGKPATKTSPMLARTG